MLFLGSGAALEPSSIVRLGNRLGGTYIGPQPLPDGVWSPTLGTWAANVHDYFSIDERILIADGVQVPFAGLSTEAGTDWPMTDRSAIDPLLGYTRIEEFEVPDIKLNAGDDPIVVNRYSDGSRSVIEYWNGQGDSLTGAYVFYNLLGERSHLSFASPLQRMRVVSMEHQIGDMFYGAASVDGQAPVILSAQLPSSDPGTLPDIYNNPALKFRRSGYVLGTTLGEDEAAILASTFDNVDWIKDASTRSTNSDIMQIPMWDESAAATSSSPTVEENTNTDPIPEAQSFLDTLPELYNWGQHQTHVTGQRTGYHIGNPERIFDGNLNTYGNAQSASWQSCAVHFPSVPVSRIVVDVLSHWCNLGINGVNQSVTQGQVIDFDPPEIVNTLSIGDGTGIRNNIGMSVLGPHPIYVDDVPLNADGVPLYTN